MRYTIEIVLLALTLSTVVPELFLLIGLVIGLPYEVTIFGVIYSYGFYGLALLGVRTVTGIYTHDDYREDAVKICRFMLVLT